MTPLASNLYTTLERAIGAARDTAEAGATLHNVAEADAWLAQVRERIMREIDVGKDVLI